MRRIAGAPGISQVRDDLADEPLRFYPVWNYLVIYREVTPVQIVRVLYAARDVVGELRDSD